MLFTVVSVQALNVHIQGREAGTFYDPLKNAFASSMFQKSKQNIGHLNEEIDIF